MENPIIRRLGRSLVFPFLVIFLFEVIARLILASENASTIFVVLPLPSKIVLSFFNLLTNMDILEATGRTLIVTILGFSLGIIGAIGVGVILGSYRSIEGFIAPFLHFMRSLPVILYVPIALVLLSADLRVPICLSALVTTLYGSLPVMRAVREYDREKKLFLQVRGISELRIIMNFVLPEIFSALYVSISIAITLALAVTVVAEMLLPSLNGLGAQIIHSKEQNHYQELWALTSLLGLCGFVLHNAILGIWRFVAPWSSEQRGGDRA